VVDVLIFWSSCRPSVKDKDLTIDPGLLEIPHPTGMICLTFSRDKSRLFDFGYAPILITNPSSCNRLSLTLRVPQNPTIDHRAAMLVSLGVRLFWPHLESEIKHRHVKIGAMSELYYAFAQ
jgi:hypothetical protein